MANTYDITTYIQALETAKAAFAAASKGVDVRESIVNQCEAIIDIAEQIIADLNDAVEMSLAVPDTTLTQQGKPAEAAATGTRIDTKMDKNNPSGTGSFSMNRQSGESMGQNAAALGDGSHAETYASFAAGYNASVKLINSDGPIGAIALGDQVTANAKNLIALGCANLEDSGGDNKLLVVGNGYLSGGSLHDSNAMTLDWDGNAWFAGEIKVGGADYEHGSELAPKSWVTSQGYATTSAMNTALSGKVNTSDVSNSISTDASSTSKVPSVKAIKDYVDSFTPSGIVDQTIVQNSTNAVSGGAVYTALAGKQDALTIDTELSNSSPNPVKNSVIFTALSKKFDTLDVSNNMTTDGSSTTKVPCCKAIKKYVDDAIAAALANS